MSQPRQLLLSRFFCSGLVFLAWAIPGRAQVVLSEIHYHPVEKSAFKADGTPVVDLTEDRHEFVKIQNLAATAVDLSGWKLTSGVKFTFPNGTTIAAGGFRVVAADPVRLAVVYPGLSGVLGPYSGVLKNSGETQKLVNAGGTTVDTVTYGTTFPWPNTADALGADADWTLIPVGPYQYKGRSLQRVSGSWAGNDPANWLASPPITVAGGGPNPGGANAVSRPAPRPVAVSLAVRQQSNAAVLIRANQSAVVAASFSAGPAPTELLVEYFVDDINLFTEPRLMVPMTPVAGGGYAAVLPGQADRKIVRYRITGNRGDGVEVVSPRADDAAIVPVGAAQREAWHSYFISPVRPGATPPAVARPIYDCFVSSTSLSRMNTNISQSPKRVTSPSVAGASSSGLPREVPYVAATAPLWNGTVPAVFVSQGVVHDIQLRYHGSRYNRNAGRNSFKVQFADYDPFEGDTSTFITDKQDVFITCQGLFQEAKLPLSTVRWVDWYLNGSAKLTRQEQGEYDGALLDAYHEKIQKITGNSSREETGEFYKSAGTLELPEGPYGSGNESLLAPVAARSPFNGWTALQRYDYTYSLQNHGWKGALPLKTMIDGLWAARGTTANVVPAANIPALRTWLEANWDVAATLNSMALLNWMCPWDDTTQNHFLWRRANGRWSHVPWDFDGMYGQGDGTSATSSIYLGEVNNPNNNSRGPNYVKDAMFKAFREEFKQRIWFTANTLCDPDNLATLTYVNSSGAVRTYLQQIGSFAASRRTSINTQTGLGIFYKPARPVNQLPAVTGGVIPSVIGGASLVGSAYVHSNTAAPRAHASSRWEIRRADGSYDVPAAFYEGPAHPTSWPIPFSELTYGSTYYWRVRYLDADGHPSILSAETPFTYLAASPAGSPLVLNEILADNRRAAPNGESYPDYVELKNRTDAVLDLSGRSLTDDPKLPRRFVFPAGTSLPPQGRMVVWCDADSSAPGLHTGFALGVGGETLLLLDGATVLDAVTFGPQAADLSLSRENDGTGAWKITLPTPDAVNGPALALGSPSGLVINEWMAEPLSGEDWFELYNPDANPVALGGLHLSDSAANPILSRLPALAFIKGRSYFRFHADGSPLGFQSVNFKLSLGGSSLILTDSDGLTPLTAVTFGTQAAGVAQGRLPDGSNTILSFPGTASPARSNYIPAPVVINEVLSNSTAPLVDQVELLNISGATVDTAGWWLSDDAGELRKFRIPGPAALLPGGFAVFSETQFNDPPGAPLAFALSSLGEGLFLSETAPDGSLTGRRSTANFGAAAENVSYGRIVTGDGVDYAALTGRTFGAANAPVQVGPVVINEIMFHPADTAGPAGPEDNTGEEYVELGNVSGTIQNLSGWTLRDGTGFTFPAGTTLADGAFLLVVGFDPMVDTVRRAGFIAKYNLPVAAVLVGPFAPELDNSDASLELARPNTPVTAPGILVDRVHYRAAAPWPVGADGSGLSLGRRAASSYGNDPLHWSPVVPTPGQANPAVLDSDADGMPDAWEIAYQLNPNDASDAADDSDADGLGNLAEYAAGTNPRDAGSSLSPKAVLIPGSVRLQFMAQAGRTYTIEASPGLTGVWTKVANLPAVGAVSAIDYDLGSPAGLHFYRVVTPARP